MATNNYTKYDEDFKNPFYYSIKTVKPKPSSVMSMGYPLPH